MSRTSSHGGAALRNLRSDVDESATPYNAKQRTDASGLRTMAVFPRLTAAASPDNSTSQSPRGGSASNGSLQAAATGARNVVGLGARRPIRAETDASSGSMLCGLRTMLVL